MWRLVFRGAICLGAVMPLCALAQQPAPTPEAVWTYRVTRGDDLFTLSRNFLAPGVSWRKLQDHNRVADPLRLSPGRELRVPVKWLRTIAAVATVDFIVGRARRQSPGGEVAPLAVGDTLRTGDLLLTDADANVTLKLTDASRVLVSANSRVRIDELITFGQGVAGSRLHIEKGEIDSRVNPKGVPGTRYDVRSPVLTLGVRGTEFRVRVGEDAATFTEVTEGRVAAAPVASGVEKPIAAGFGAVASPSRAAPAVLPLPAAPGLGTLPLLYERIPLRFSWPALPGAVGYRAQVLAEDSVDKRLLDGVFEQPGAQWADLPDGRYQLQVRARNAEGLEGRDGRLVFTLKARPEPPFTTAPRDEGRVYGERVDFSWTTMPAAQRYRLQVASDARFETLLLDREDITDTKFGMALQPGRYYWRLRSIAQGDDVGPASDAVGFELRAVPPPPAVDAPKEEGGKTVIRWRARSGDDAYDVQLARDAAFTQLVTERREDLPEMALPDLPAGTYYLRVRTIESDGFVGAYGSAQQFSVPYSLWWWTVPGALLLLLL
jgi:hypothetical protein